MKKLSVCVVLLLMSAPLFAAGTGLGIGATGGIEMMMNGDSENFMAIGGIVDFSMPGMPIALRGGFEYAWKNFEGDISSKVMLILLAAQYNIVLPGAPMSFYIGAGGEMAMTSVDFPDPLPDPDSETNFGFLVYGGACYNMGNIGIFAETGYGMIFSDPSMKHIPIRGGVKVNL